MSGQKPCYAVGKKMENCRTLILFLHLIALRSTGTSGVNNQVLALQLRLTC